jgi:hypothetical protein
MLLLLSLLKKTPSRVDYTPGGRQKANPNLGDSSKALPPSGKVFKQERALLN